MKIDEVRKIYSFPPFYSDEIGRYISPKGATYVAWQDGAAHKIDNDAVTRKYGEEGGVFFNWKKSTPLTPPSKGESE